jgi:hypothetical protein
MMMMKQLCLFVLVAVSALAEAGRERRQLVNAILGSALGYGNLIH